MRIQTLLLITLIPIVSLSLIVTTSYSINQYTKLIEKDIESDLSSIAAITLDQISRIMHQRFIDVNFLTSPTNFVLSGSQHTLAEKLEYLRDFESKK